MKKFVFVFILQSFAKIESYFFLYFWNLILGHRKPHFSFWLKINIRKIASNKDFDLRKIENFVRSKCYPEDRSKDEGKKANFRKSYKNFKIVNMNRTKGKKREIFANDGKLLLPRFNSILL